MNAKSPLHVFVQGSSTVDIAISPLNANQAFTCSTPSSYATKTNTTTNSVTFGGNSEGIVGVTVTSAGNSSVKVNFDIVVITQFASLQGRMIGSQYLWTGPSTIYEHTTENILTVGQNVTIYGSYGSYYYINAGGYVGFVLKSNVGIQLYFGNTADPNPEDMRFNDRTYDQILEMRTMTVSDLTQTPNNLISKFRNVGYFLALGDGYEAAVDALVDRFLAGTGQDYENTIVTSVSKGHDTTKNFLNAFRTSVNQALSENGGDLSTILANDSAILRAKMVSNKVWLSSYSYNTGLLAFATHGLTTATIHSVGGIVSNNTLTGDLTVVLTDNFGLDAADIVGDADKDGVGDDFPFGPNWRAWYILQHYTHFNGAHRPFRTVMTMRYSMDNQTIS